MLWPGRSAHMVEISSLNRISTEFLVNLTPFYLCLRTPSVSFLLEFQVLQKWTVCFLFKRRWVEEVTPCVMFHFYKIKTLLKKKKNQGQNQAQPPCPQLQQHINLMRRSEIEHIDILTFL